MDGAGEGVDDLDAVVAHANGNVLARRIHGCVFDGRA